MAITQVDKLKILKYFRETAFGDFYYTELVKCLGKKSKVTDDEFTDFFASYVIDNLKKEKPSFNLINKMVSVLTSFIGWLHDDKIEIDIGLLNKLHSIRECYEQCLTNTNVERNNTDGLITSFEEKLNEFYPRIEQQEESVELEPLLIELENLKSVLADSEKEIMDLTSRLAKQTKAWEIKRKDNARLVSRLEVSEKKKSQLKDKVKELEEKIVQLNEHILVLEGKLTSAGESYDILSGLKDRIQSDYYSLKADMKALRKKLDDKEKEIVHLREENEFKIIVPRSIDYNEDKKNRIEALIIQKMLTGKNTLVDIREYLAINGYVLTIDELRKHFESISMKMSYDISYDGIESIEVKENDEYVIPVSEDTKCIDLLVVSDFHLSSSFDKDIISEMELINDYCEENGIKTILNAGDFFSWTRLKGKQRGSVCQRIVDKAILKYPSRKGIKHAILGGNHDKDMLAVGVDPLQLMAEAREDFINLGYSHCKITFGGSISILDSIGMHHPNRRFPEILGDSEYSTSKMRDMINNYNIGNGIESDNIYVDLLGHIHKSSLDTENGICIVPSYRKDRTLNGAWHLKVYFKDNHISNIVFIPVIKTKNLIPTTEINYQKRLILK